MSAFCVDVSAQPQPARRAPAHLVDDYDDSCAGYSPPRVLAALAMRDANTPPQHRKPRDDVRRCPPAEQRLPIHERCAAQQRDLEQRRRLAAQQREEREMAEATFTPQVNHSVNSSMCSDSRPACARLYDDASERVLRREERRALEAAAPRSPHRPRTNNSSRSTSNTDVSLCDDGTPRHDRLLQWGAEKRMALAAKQASHSRDAQRDATFAPHIDPVSRALAESGTVRRRAPLHHPHPRGGRHEQHAHESSDVAPAPSTPLSKGDRRALVDRLYYQDREVRELERRVAEARAERERAASPTISRRSRALVGADLPAQPRDAVHERLLREGARTQQRLAESKAAADRAAREQADVRHYVGPVSHLLAEVRSATPTRVGAKRERKADADATDPQRNQPSPKLTRASRRIDAAANGGREVRGAERVALMHAKHKNAVATAQRKRAENQARAAAAAREMQREGQRLATADGYGATPAAARPQHQDSSVAELPFDERQRLWMSARAACVQRLQHERQTAATQELAAACTFSPRINKTRPAGDATPQHKAPPARELPRKPASRGPIHEIVDLKSP